ncbi:MAG TPA: hypothetical protein VGO78_12935, partial [Acidimicrobiales bacterium]|nr:hypothetical protein [Acidimicrobiales bacterium]
MGAMRAAARLALVGALALAATLTTPAGRGAGAGAGAEGDLSDPGAYPSRGAQDIKGLQPDGWSDRAGLTGLGIVAVNFHQAQWEPTPVPAPCPADRVEYDGRCFVVPAADE